MKRSAPIERRTRLKGKVRRATAIPYPRRHMVGSTYRWRGATWRVICRWRGRGPRNVLLERVVLDAYQDHSIADPMVLGNENLRYSEGRWWRPTGECTVRPFRGLRRLPDVA
jgi:hypothetical protein